MAKSTRFAIGCLAICVFALQLTACVPIRGCSLVGFESGLGVYFWPDPESYPDGDLEVELTVPDRVFSATWIERSDIRAVLDPEFGLRYYDGGHSPTSGHTDGTWLSDDHKYYVQFTADEIQFGVFNKGPDNKEGDLPQIGVLRVRSNGKVLLEEAFEANYETFEPNGEGCGEQYSAQFEYVVPSN